MVVHGNLKVLFKPWYDCILENWAIPKRVNVNKELIDKLVSKGTPRNQIFMSGQSCGGIDKTQGT